MKIDLSISPNQEVVPFDYQQLLTGVIHKWLGSNNDLHDVISLYSFSWLMKGSVQKNGFDFKNGAQWAIGAHDNELIKKLIDGIQHDPKLFAGMSVAELTIVQDPNFGIVKRFEVASPIFIKRHVGDRTKFYYYNDDEANALMTETLVNKLKKADLNHENVSVEFDKTYRNPTKKGTTYKGIKSIGSICPVIIKGTPEQIAFAWNVGLGNSTGIGFGALV